MSALAAYLDQQYPTQELERIIAQDVEFPEGWPGAAFQGIDFAWLELRPSGIKQTVSSAFRRVYAAYALRQMPPWRWSVSIIARARLGAWPTPAQFPARLLVSYAALSILLGDPAETRELGRRIDRSDWSGFEQNPVLDRLELCALVALARGDREVVGRAERLGAAKKDLNATVFDLRRAAALGALIQAVVRLDEADIARAAADLERVLREELERGFKRFARGRPSEISAYDLLDLSAAAVLVIARGAGLSAPTSPFFDLDWISQANENETGA